MTLEVEEAMEEEFLKLGPKERYKKANEKFTKEFKEVIGRELKKCFGYV